MNAKWYAGIVWKLALCVLCLLGVIFLYQKGESKHADRTLSMTIDGDPKPRRVIEVMRRNGTQFLAVRIDGTSATAYVVQAVSGQSLEVEDRVTVETCRVKGYGDIEVISIAWKR